MLNTTIGRRGVSRPAGKSCAAALALMSLAASALMPAMAQTVGAAPQEATAPPPKTVDLSTVPKVGATTGTVVKQMLRPQNGLSDSEYWALKERVARHPPANAPAGKMSPPPALIGGHDGSSVQR
jgi:hypothetical protein